MIFCLEILLHYENIVKFVLSGANAENHGRIDAKT